MRKYENVDIAAVLGAVLEVNTEHYRSDFKYDLEMFKKAALSPDGENNRFLWLSRINGTYCHLEREAYIKNTEAFHWWTGNATILGDINSYMSSVIVQDRIMAYAVVVTGLENRRVMGNLYQLDYRDSVRDVHRTALPLHTISAKYEDGTEYNHMSHAEHNGQQERLYHQHGKITDYRVHPEDESTLQTILNKMREKREKDAAPATFKVRVQTQKPRKPSLTRQVKNNQEQIARDRAAAPSSASKWRTQEH
jgi:hypothetical protein